MLGAQAEDHPARMPLLPPALQCSLRRRLDLHQHNPSESIALGGKSWITRCYCRRSPWKDAGKTHDTVSGQDVRDSLDQLGRLCRHVKDVIEGERFGPAASRKLAGTV